MNYLLCSGMGRTGIPSWFPSQEALRCVRKTDVDHGVHSLGVSLPNPPGISIGVNLQCKNVGTLPCPYHPSTVPILYIG